MPAITRWYVRTSLLYLIGSLTLAALLAVAQVIAVPQVLQAAGPVYFHLFLVGWVTQLIMGIVYWMFPKYSKERPRGREGLAVATYVLLNTGLLLRVLGEPAKAVNTAAVWSWALVASAGLQWLAGIFFVGNTWSRVMER